MNINNVLLFWYKSYKGVEDNSTKLLKAEHLEEFNKVSKECSDLMEKVFESEFDLYSIKDYALLPKPLVDHLEAEEDKGCLTCWCSSVRKKYHADGTPSCHAKIERWFDTQDKLLDYVEKELINEQK